MGIHLRLENKSMSLAEMNRATRIAVSRGEARLKAVSVLRSWSLLRFLVHVLGWIRCLLINRTLTRLHFGPVSHPGREVLEEGD